MEKTLLFLHILCAAIWLGGGATSVTHLLAAKNAKPDAAKPTLQNLSNLGKFIFGPASMLVLITGIGLISVAGWSFSDLWITLAFSGFIASTILGTVFHARAGKKALAAVESGDAQATSAAISGWLVIAYIDVAIIVSILAVMVYKPGV